MRNRRITGKVAGRFSSDTRRETQRTACATLILMEVPSVAKQATADKRQRRERGSINPDDIIRARSNSPSRCRIDNLSMPLLGKHLGVGVTSIYWYFRKKDDLLNAMTDRALTPVRVRHPVRRGQRLARDAAQPRPHDAEDVHGQPDSVRPHPDPVGAEPAGRQIGVQEVEKAIAGLVEAGLSAEDAFDTYSAVSVHVRGSVVLQRLYEKNQRRRRTGHALRGHDGRSTPRRHPLLAQVTGEGHHIGAADDNNFEYGLDCILDHADG